MDRKDPKKSGNNKNSRKRALSRIVGDFSREEKLIKKGGSKERASF
jgi:hypothetical protein